MKKNKLIINKDNITEIDQYSVLIFEEFDSELINDAIKKLNNETVLEINIDDEYYSFKYELDKKLYFTIVDFYLEKLQEKNIVLMRKNNNLLNKNNQLLNKINELDEKYEASNDHAYELIVEKKRFNRTLVGKGYHLYRKVRTKTKTLLMGNNEVEVRQLKPLKNVKKKVINGVSIIIPTHKYQPLLEKCLNSILNQTYLDIQIILSVNGADYNYYLSLKEQYANFGKIVVVYTPIAGAGSGRNYGINYVEKEYLMFVDDDDELSNDYINQLVDNVYENVDVVVGKLVDRNNGVLNENTYINKTLKLLCKGGVVKSIHRLDSLFSSPVAKLMNSKMVINYFKPFNTSYNTMEDIIYWCDNIGYIKNYISIVSSDISQYYIRNIVDNSVSRPSAQKEFDFNINQRITVIKHLNDMIFNEEYTLDHKHFIVNKITAQTKAIYNYYESLSFEDKIKALDIINSTDIFYLNKSLFSSHRAIAFCHNFSPFADPSSYVATRRLNEISNLENRILKWDVILQDMSNSRNKDDEFSIFYTRFVTNKMFVTEGKAYFNEKSQYQWAKKAYEMAKDEEVEVIYSRSMFAGSHYAAYMYKQQYPNVKWYAEFSDPILYDAKNERRLPVTNYSGVESHLNTFWEDCESIVYQHADQIIFTNDNQKTFMLGYYEHQELVENINIKSLVMAQPTLPHDFTKIYNYNYFLDNRVINIAYFGSLLDYRQGNDIFNLINNKKVVIHFFTNQVDKVLPYESDQVIVNGPLPYLAFLNVASKMDYLIINDTETNFPLNPFIPSKLSDYLCSDSKILCKYVKGSVLSKMDNPKIIKTASFDKKLADSLVKEKK
ncbi:MAG: glycosyltransferase [Erysipelotrichaceae bacterium]